jgi:NACHT domain
MLKNHKTKRQNLNLKLTTKKVFLLVDGFDECCENVYVKNRVIAFMKKYLRYECPLWVTTRPHVQQELRSIMENDFVRVLDINPFHRENQKALFTRKAKMNNIECEAFLDGFAEKGGRDLASNPLHLCMMAEAVRNNLQIDHKLFALYDTFLQLKIQNALIAEGFTLQKIKDKMLARKITVLKAAALTLKGESAQSLTEEEIRDINNVGLAIVANNTIRYVHETFYEFLVAQLYLLPEDLRESSNIHVDTQEVFANKDLHHIRKQIDNYCEVGHAIEEEHFLATFTSSSEAFSSVMTLICKEGLLNIFQSLLSSVSTVKDRVLQFWMEPELFQSQGCAFLYNACCTNEKLAMIFIAMGANFKETSLQSFQRA